MIRGPRDVNGERVVSSNEDAIKRVVEAFERSDWSEIDVRSGEVRIHLAKVAPNGPVTTPTTSAAERTPPTTPDPRAEDEASVARATAAEPLPSGAHLVVAPSPGILWRSPEPGVPPFVEVGRVVEPSATVCIVEVMKLMNHVKAGVGGEVVAVCVDNGGAVHKGQVLFAIAPSAAPS